MDKYRGEKVLVIKRAELFEKGDWQGLKTDELDLYYRLLLEKSQFIERCQAEQDENYKQIIPYILYQYQDNFFFYEYLSGASESRLKQTKSYILGIAGHINPVDSADKTLTSKSPVNKNSPHLKKTLSTLDLIQQGAKREWAEEVEIGGSIINEKFLGILNDDRREVERVHLGLIYLYLGDSAEIFIKEKHKILGRLLTIEEMRPFIGDSQKFPGWAPLIFPYLEKILK